MKPIRAFALALLAAWPAGAAHLPVQVFTAAEGLARDDVARLLQDSRGFLWIATGEGLSRFDGYRFVNYGTADGLPDDQVLDILETEDHVYWVATSTGLCRYDPASVRAGSGPPRPLFTAVPLEVSGFTRTIRVLRDDGTGGLWLGTGDGLLRLRRDGPRWVAETQDLGVRAAGGQGAQVNAIVEDGRGQIWVATRGLGLFRRSTAGTWDRWTTDDGLPSPNVHDLLARNDGFLWVACGRGVCRLRLDAAPHSRPDLELTTGLPSYDARTLAAGEDGRLFVGTQQGLAEILFAHDGSPLRALRRDVAPGGATLWVSSLAAGRDGVLWIGTLGAGLLRLDLRGATRYGVDDGLLTTKIVALMNTTHGIACVGATDAYDSLVLHRFEDGRFVPTRLNVPSPVGGWGWSQLLVEDRDGSWWVPSAHGVWRLPPVRRLEDLAHAPARIVATERDGLPSDEVFRLWEDSRGDIWISAYGLARFDRATGRATTLRDLAGVVPQVFPSSFVEDRAGHVWVGAYSGGLIHCVDGRFEAHGPADGVPAGLVGALHLDSRGRLWVGTSDGGAARLDEPDGPRGRAGFRAVEGLASRDVEAIVEDRLGRLYFAGGRGVDRLDPDSGRIDRITTAEGLVGGTLSLALADRDGRLWFASSLGIASLEPQPDLVAPPPVALLFDVRVAGEPVAVSPLGEPSAQGLVLDSQRRRLDVDFAVVDTIAGERIRYEHRLVGADESWTPASTSRSAEFANLAPGRYRFDVRALAQDGRPGPSASVAFVVRPPLWRRPELLGTALVALGLGAWWTHRRRLARALDLERIRTGIATDLHDDLGSTLTRIAVVSESVRRGLPAGADGTAALGRVAQAARDAVESLADIVWSVDPLLDRVAALVRRMRSFAEEMTIACGCELRFDVSGAGSDRELPADVRRASYLAFKESVTNALRHSGCRCLEVTFVLDDQRLTLEVRDDGAGFDPQTSGSGRGLGNLTRRAERLGGTLRIESGPGRGTVVRFEVPLPVNRPRPSVRTHSGAVGPRRGSL